MWRNGGGAVADSARHLRDGAAARGTVGAEAGPSVSVFERGLVALDLARAHAGAAAGAQLRFKGGVFGDRSLEAT
jgi:hypothetical protein